MEVRDIIYEDLSNLEITNICNKLYYYINSNSSKDLIYIEYRILKNRTNDFAGDNPLTKDINIQVDIFSKNEEIDKYYKLEKIIPKVLKTKDYSLYDDIELFEDETELWHRAFRFNKKIFIEEMI